MISLFFRQTGWRQRRGQGTLIQRRLISTIINVQNLLWCSLGERGDQFYSGASRKVSRKRWDLSWSLKDFDEQGWGRGGEWRKHTIWTWPWFLSSYVTLRILPKPLNIIIFSWKLEKNNTKLPWRLNKIKLINYWKQWLENTRTLGRSHWYWCYQPQGGWQHLTSL